MLDPLNNKNINSDQAAALVAERVMKEYTETPDPLTDKECKQRGIDTTACHILVESLGRGKDGVLDEDKKKHLLDAGFAQNFIDALAGSDGTKALKRRVRWLAERDKVTLQELIELEEAPLPCLLNLMKDEDYGVRLRAMHSIMENPDKRKTPLPILIEALKDKVTTLDATFFLEEIGPQAKAALPVLIGHLKDESFEIRKVSAGAIKKIASEPETVPGFPEVTMEPYKLDKILIIDRDNDRLYDPKVDQITTLDGTPLGQYDPRVKDLWERISDREGPPLKGYRLDYASELANRPRTWVDSLDDFVKTSEILFGIGMGGYMGSLLLLAGVDGVVGIESSLLVGKAAFYGGFLIAGGGVFLAGVAGIGVGYLLDQGVGLLSHGQTLSDWLSGDRSLPVPKNAPAKFQKPGWRFTPDGK